MGTQGAEQSQRGKILHVCVATITDIFQNQIDPTTIIEGYIWSAGVCEVASAASFQPPYTSRTNQRVRVRKRCNFTEISGHCDPMSAHFQPCFLLSSSASLSQHQLKYSLCDYHESAALFSAHVHDTTESLVTSTALIKQETRNSSSCLGVGRHLKFLCACANMSCDYCMQDIAQQRCGTAITTSERTGSLLAVFTAVTTTESSCSTPLSELLFTVESTSTVSAAVYATSG